MLGQFCTLDPIAAPAIVGIEIVDLAERAPQRLRQRHDIGADPVGDSRGHWAAQLRRGLERRTAAIRQHHRLQPDQIVAAAGAVVDGRDRRRHRNGVSQGLAAVRRLRLGGRCGRSRRRVSLKRTGLRQRHRRLSSGASHRRDREQCQRRQSHHSNEP